MDGTSRAKLVEAGYAIYRMRDVYPIGGGDVAREIREMSSRGQWVLYDRYPTKAARERAWKELAKDKMNVMESDGYSTDDKGGEMANEQQLPETTTETGVLAKVEDTVAAKYGLQIREMEREHEYNLLRVEADTKIKGQAMQESFSRLMRTMFLRQTKERLKEVGLWSRYCQDTGIDIKKADHEIDKLGEFRDETLLNFSTFCGYDINKIKYLTNGNSQKLGVTIENGEIFVKGEKVPLTPEDVQFVINSLQDDLRKQEEKAAEEKADLEKGQIETKKALKKAERELKKIKGDAEKNGLTPEEEGFMKELESIRADFDKLFVRLNPDNADERTMTAYINTLDYMRLQIAGAYGTSESKC